MEYTYLIVFNYTKNGNAYFTNKTITIKLPFSEDDLVTQEEIATKENGHKTRIVGLYTIEKSRKPKEG